MFFRYMHCLNWRLLLEEERAVVSVISRRVTNPSGGYESFYAVKKSTSTWITSWLQISGITMSFTSSTGTSATPYSRVRSSGSAGRSGRGRSLAALSRMEGRLHFFTARQLNTTSRALTVYEGALWLARACYVSEVLRETEQRLTENKQHPTRSVGGFFKHARLRKTGLRVASSRRKMTRRVPLLLPLVARSFSLYLLLLYLFVFFL